MRKPFLLFLFLVSLGIATQAQDKPDSLKEYAGVYVFPDGSVVPEVEVILNDTTLTINSSAGSSLLVKQDKDLYTIVEFSGTALFKRNEAGKVVAVHIEAGGYILDGTKKETSFWIRPAKK